jgi:manganese efflux pump family protein
MAGTDSKLFAMNLLALLIFSILISTVPFSVALNSSVYRCIQWKEALRAAFFFALFQVVMVAIGWIIGYNIKGLFHDLKIPVAGVIIIFTAARMFADSRRLSRENRTMAVESLRILMGFAFVISINTTFLSIGLGILYRDILILCGFVFGTVFIMTIGGVYAGKRGMMNLGRTAETIGSAGLFLMSAIIILQYMKIL